MKKNLKFILIGILLCFISVPAAADQIWDNRSTDAYLLGPGYWGQSVVIFDGTWTNLEFNFYSDFDDPIAFGSIYLLNEKYPYETGLSGANNGQPAYLSANTKGYIASASTKDGLGNFVEKDYWSFGPSVSISAGTYWFYTNHDKDLSILGGIASGTTGEDAYFSDFGTNPYSGPYSGVNFTLTGTPVPEPATMILFGTGLIGLAGAVRRRKIKF